MIRILITTLFIFFSFISFAQTTTRSDKIIANDSLKVAGNSIGKISRDTLLADNSDYELSTQKAIKAYVLNHSGGSGTSIDTNRLAYKDKPNTFTNLNDFNIISLKELSDTTNSKRTYLYYNGGVGANNQYIDFPIGSTTDSVAYRSWVRANSGGGGLTDTTSLSNRINKKWDSIIAKNYIAANYLTANSNFAWNKLIGTPTTLLGYGITNAYPLTSNPSGFLVSETDPIYSASSWFNTINNSTNWNTAYSWGNHAGLYPLISGSYTNPSWIASLPYSKITGTPTLIDTTGIRVQLKAGTNIASITGTYPIQTINAATQTTDISGKVDKTTTVNGYPLSSNVTIGKNDIVGLQSSLDSNIKIKDSLTKYITPTVLFSKVDKIIGKGLSERNYSTSDSIRLLTTIGTNTGDQDLTPYATKSKVISDSILFASTKVDTIIKVNDSTIAYKINGNSHNLLIRGTNVSIVDTSLLLHKLDSTYGYTTRYKTKQDSIILQNQITTNTTNIAANTANINIKVNKSDSLLRTGYVTPTVLTADSLLIMSVVNTKGVGTVTSLSLGNGLSSSTNPITTSGGINIDTTSSFILSRQRAAATYQVIGNYAYADSTLWQTKYRSDTNRTNVYNAINTNTFNTTTNANNILLRLKYTDSSAMLLAYNNAINNNTASISTNTVNILARLKYTDTASMLSAYQAAINTKGVGTITGVTAGTNMTGGGTTGTVILNADTTTGVTKLSTQGNVTRGLATKIDSIRLVNSGLIHTTPATFSLSGTTGIITQTLANQLPYTILRRGSGIGTPSWSVIDTNYFNGMWAAYVRAAQNSGGGGISGNILSGRITYGASSTSISSNGNFTYDSTNAGGIRFGDTLTGAGVTNPSYIDFGSNYLGGNNPITNINIRLLHTSSVLYGFGVTNSGLNYISNVHNFINQSNGSGTVQINANNSNGNIVLTGSNAFMLANGFSGTAGQNPKYQLYASGTGIGISGSSIDYTTGTVSFNHAFWVNNGGTVTRAATIFNTTGNLRLGITNTDPSDKLGIEGNLSLLTPGNKIKIATGTNASLGSATLINGTVTVSTTAISANSQVRVEYKTGTALSIGIGNISTMFTVPTVTPATSFVITALTVTGTTNTTDNSTVEYFIIN